MARTPGRGSPRARRGRRVDDAAPGRGAFRSLSFYRQYGYTTQAHPSAQKQRHVADPPPGCRSILGQGPVTPSADGEVRRRWRQRRIDAAEREAPGCARRQESNYEPAGTTSGSACGASSGAASAEATRGVSGTVSGSSVSMFRISGIRNATLAATTVSAPVIMKYTPAPRPGPRVSRLPRGVPAREPFAAVSGSSHPSTTSGPMIAPGMVVHHAITRRAEKTRPCTSGSTLRCQIAWLHALLIGIRNSIAKPATVIRGRDIRTPSRILASPGPRLPKGFELLLRSAGVLPAG